MCPRNHDLTLMSDALCEVAGALAADLDKAGVGVGIQSSASFARCTYPWASRNAITCCASRRLIFSESARSRADHVSVPFVRKLSAACTGTDGWTD